MSNENSSLIQTVIRQRKIIYYLCSKEDLENIKSSNFWGDIFFALASLVAGGLVSVWLTRLTAIDLGESTSSLLNVFSYVFVLFFLLFATLAVIFHVKSHWKFREVIGSGEVTKLAKEVSHISGDTEIGARPSVEKPAFEIISAKYWTQNKALNIEKALLKYVKEGKLDVVANNEIAGDPDHGVKKKLTIKYRFNGIVIEKEFNEKDHVVLP